MKKILSIILIISLLAGSSCFAFADDTEGSASASVIVITPALLEERMLTTGTAIELANIKKLQDKAVAKSNSDAQKALEDAYAASGMLQMALANPALTDVQKYSIQQTLASMPSDTIQLKMVELTKDYYNKNYEKNYEASLNQIKEDAVSTFYQMLQVQEYYKIAKESLAIAENTLELVQKKYKLGSASKLELLSAQVDYQSAVASEASAKNTYETAVMGFNMANSYPLLSELVFEGGDDLVTAPAIELGEAIKLAVANRNEVGQMHFYKEIQDVSWRHTQLTSSNGSVDYLNAKAANMQVSMADRLIEAQIELEIRQRFGDIEAKRLAAQSADKTLELAKEAYNITQISYKLGAATLNELRTASNTLSQAKLGRVAAVSDYNLAVKELEFAVGVGTTAISVGN